MTPKEVVEKWVVAFNNADVNTLVNLYTDKAIYHQVATDAVVSKEAIRKLFTEEFANAKMVFGVENIFEDGEWAILEWKDPKGVRGCGFFYVLDGKINFQRGYWDKLSFLKLHGLPLD